MTIFAMLLCAGSSGYMVHCYLRRFRWFFLVLAAAAFVCALMLAINIAVTAIDFELVQKGIET